MYRINKKYLNEQGELILRPSSLGKIMTNGKVKGELSAGAKTYLKTLFKETYLGYEEELDGKEITKGITQEHEGIELLNLLHSKKYMKNEQTVSNGWIKGTADIVVKNYIRDVKLSWSKKTFPLFPEDAKNDLYEWQLRGYMLLYDKPKAYLDYCLIETDPKLVPAWESYELHRVNDIPVNMRVTTLQFERDMYLESLIYEKIELCRREWKNMYNQIMK
jgi:hypothetical protein